MSSVDRQVGDFQRALGRRFSAVPGVPDDVAALRAQLLLIVEDVFELLCAFGLPADRVEHMVKQALHHPIRPDLVEVADALADIDYVVAGLRFYLGIDGEPIADAVHRSNMEKLREPRVYREDGKLLKPAGWRPPDIAGELRRQGWEG
jgi:predicted HAD superfamily Cof-like phosphohydrolase